MTPYARDLRGYGREPPHARWPRDARIAVQFVINYEEGGFLYSADSYADDLPYWIEGPFLIVPYTLDANDMRFATAQGFSSGDQFYAYLKDSFDVLYREGAERPRMLSIGLHCRLAGRPGRTAASSGIGSSAMPVSGWIDIDRLRRSEACSDTGCNTSEKRGAQRHGDSVVVCRLRLICQRLIVCRHAGVLITSSAMLLLNNEGLLARRRYATGSEQHRHGGKNYECSLHGFGPSVQMFDGTRSQTSVFSFVKADEDRSRHVWSCYDTAGTATAICQHECPMTRTGSCLLIELLGD